MTILDEKPFSSVLAGLLADATASDQQLREMIAREGEDGLAKLMKQARENYAGFYGETTKEHFLAVSPETGRLLYMLARSTRARNIVEFGTSFGISTLFLAAALRDNGGGKLITAEFVAAKATRARQSFEDAGVSDLIELREGDARTTLARDVPHPVDMVLLDGAKALYPEVLALLEPRLSPGALIVADNADDSPEYLALIRDSRRYLSVPFAEDVELTQYLGL